ncbi:Pentatricopeptide repeat [Macleaya cordata]|uniref:Pentatricopeptide repeat n=1 Tax=Macleaya cordata TaxID=56857 RepID=A0A200PRJ8_MACCD|nr:Pentatricopeptide repeat [Macleaya cordata]
MMHQAIIHSPLLLDKKNDSTIIIILTRSNSTTVTSSDPLQKLNHKNWLAPNEVLKIFKTLRDPDSVINVLERVSQRKDYKPNETLYTLVIQKLCQSKKFYAIPEILKRIKTEKKYHCKLSDEFFYFVIKIYGNVAGYIDEAIKTLFSMPDYNCWPSIKTFNYVLNMLIAAKQYEIVHEVYLGAPKLGLVIDTCSLNILIKGLCENDKLNEAFELLNEYPKQGCMPNAKTYSTLMHCLCSNGRVDEAFQLLDRMEMEGCDPDTITFNVLISGLGKQGRVDEGIELLDRMKIKGCYPNSGSYQAVLYGILDSKKFVDAKCFMDRMILEGGFPSFLSYKLVIDGLCKENRLEDLDLVLDQMVHRGFVPKMGMWKKIVQSVLGGGKN